VGEGGAENEDVGSLKLTWFPFDRASSIR